MRDMTLSRLARAQAEAAAAEWARSMDEDAFRSFYDSTARPLWAYLSRLTGSPQAADDLLQESYYRLVRSRLAFADEAHRRHYLFRIATNLARDRARSARTEHVPLEDTPERGAGSVSQLESRRTIAQGMARLGARDRSLLWLAYAEGSTHQEIAATLGLRPASIRVLLYRARRRLAAVLGAVEKREGTS